MRLHEYQSKELMAAYDIPVPAGGVALTANEATRIAETLGYPVVLKAQVHAGARGRAGGIVTANTLEEVQAAAAELLGSQLRTGQTGSQTLPVNALLVERALEFAREAYVAFTVAPSTRRVTCIAGAQGGADIEELATSSPETIVSIPIDSATGLLRYQCRKATAILDPGHGSSGATDQLLFSAYKLFVENDCSLLEVNPLAFTPHRNPVALDAKVSIDDSALFRHEKLAALRDETQVDPIERESSRIGVSYVKLNGSIGCLVNGAGLAMATMDLITLMGGSPANFLDVGGAASEDQVAAAFGLLLSDPDVKVALVNIFGGILRCDVVATALLRVLERHRSSVPLVVRMHGTNSTEATRLLERGAMRVMIERDLTQAARLAAATAKSTGK